MAIEIKDYLHLYLGCTVIIDEGNMTNEELLFSEATLIGVVDNQVHLIHNETNQYGECRFIKYVKPILYLLSGITEDEKRECYVIGQMRYKRGMAEMNFYQIDSKQFIYLLSKHFDLFGLIEAGLAIDASKIKKETV